jgi:NTE family protein
VLLVQINPRARRKTPRSAREIMTRLHEITFNASLVAEMRALGQAEALIEAGGLPRGIGPGQYRRLRLHRIMLDDIGEAFDDADSRLKRDFKFFELLHKRGQRAARRFLDAHFDDIGRRSTIALPPPVEAAVA